MLLVKIAEAALASENVLVIQQPRSPVRLHKVVRNCGMIARSARPQSGSLTSCATRATWQAVCCNTLTAREEGTTARSALPFQRC